MKFNESELNKGIYIPDLLLIRGILKPMEALLYCRCLRWYQNCKEKNETFYLDHLEAAQFFQVSRRSVITYTQSLVDAGLFIETGKTARGQKTYIVKDWRYMLEEVLANDEVYAEQQERYQAERERNRAQYNEHHEKRAEEAEEEVSTDFKQKEDSDSHIRASEPVEDVPQFSGASLDAPTFGEVEPEAPQEPVSPPIIQSEPESQTIPQGAIQSDLEGIVTIPIKNACYIGYHISKQVGDGYKDEIKEACHQFEQTGTASFKHLYFTKEGM